MHVVDALMTESSDFDPVEFQNNNYYINNNHNITVEPHYKGHLWVGY